MATDLTIVIKAVDKASAELKKVNSSTKGMKDMALGLGVALGTAAAAVGVLKQAYDKIITPTVAYGLQVKDLSIRLGVTTQEASKMIQVFDDLRIDMGSAQTAMRFMVAEGIQPTIENLASLSDQYRNIRDPIGKAAFAMKNFGARGGLEMTKLLEVGGPALREMAEEAERLGLVLGQDATQAAQDFFDATDKMDDSMKGLQITMGVLFLPVATAFVDWLTRLATGFRTAAVEGDSLFEVLMLLGVYMRDTADARDEAQQGFIAYSDVLRDRQPIFEGTAESIRDISNAEVLMQAAEAVLAGDTRLASTLMDQYNAADLLDKKLASIKERLEAGMSPEVIALQNTQADVAAAKFAAPPAARAVIQAPDITPIKVAVQQVQLAADSLKFEQMEKGMTAGVLKPVQTSLALLNTMNGKQTKSYHTVVVRYVTAGSKGKPPGVEGQHGLDFVVPSGFPNDSFPVRVSSGEHVEVTPAGKTTPPSGGGGVTINVSTSPLDVQYLTRTLKAAVGM